MLWTFGDYSFIRFNHKQASALELYTTCLALNTEGYFSRPLLFPRSASSSKNVWHLWEDAPCESGSFLSVRSCKYVYHQSVMDRYQHTAGFTWCNALLGPKYDEQQLWSITHHPKIQYSSKPIHLNTCALKSKSTRHGLLCLFINWCLGNIYF